MTSEPRRLARGVCLLFTAITFFPGLVTGATAAEVLRGVVEGRNGAVTVVECSNVYQARIQSKLKVFDSRRRLRDEIVIDLGSQKTAHFIPSRMTGLYGMYEVSLDDGEEGLNCISVIYKLAAAGSKDPVEFAYAHPMLESWREEVTGLFNTVNPDPTNPEPVRDVISIINLGTEAFNAELELRNRSGRIAGRVAISNLGPKKRRNIVVNDITTERSGMYRVIPQGGQFAAFETRSSSRGTESVYAFSLYGQPSSCDIAPLFVSTKSAASSYLEIGNGTDREVRVGYTLRGASGGVVRRGTVTLGGRKSRRLDIGAQLGGDKTGTVQIECPGMDDKVVVQSLLYGHDKQGKLSWGRGEVGTGQRAFQDAVVVIPLNTHLNGTNISAITDESLAISAINERLYQASGRALSPKTGKVSAGGVLVLNSASRLSSDSIGLSMMDTTTFTALYDAHPYRRYLNTDGDVSYIMSLPRTLFYSQRQADQPICRGQYSRRRCQTSSSSSSTASSSSLSSSSTVSSSKSSSATLSSASSSSRSSSLNSSAVSSISSSGSSSSAPGTPSAWTPPIGIPEPPFGIREVAPGYDQNNPLHYFVSGPTNCNDSNNGERGSPAQPRCTIPLNLVAGSLVEVRGGPYSRGNLWGGTEIGIQGIGTAQQPIFVRGPSTGTKPKFTKTLEITGEYLIVENFNVDFEKGLAGSVRLATPLKYAAFRNSEVHNGVPAYQSAISIAGPSLTDRPEFVVAYNNQVYENGDWQSNVEQDYRGIGIGPSQNIWVLDNRLWHNDSDAVMPNAGYGAPTTLINRIFIGRNVAWENRQGGFWTKEASDVIFSENVAFGHTMNGPGGQGHGMGWQYTPDRVWFLYNRLYNNTLGIGPASTDSGAFYLIGNVVYNNLQTGINIYNNADVRMVNNTVVNNPAGIRTSIGVNYIVNNLVENGIVDAYGHVVELRNNLELADADSQFIDVDGADNTLGTRDDDFKLRSTSAAINGGVAHSVYDTFQQLYGIDIKKDIDRDSRPQGGAWDIGADEYSATTPPASSSSSSVSSSSPASSSSSSRSSSSIAISSSSSSIAASSPSQSSSISSSSSWSTANSSSSSSSPSGSIIYVDNTLPSDCASTYNPATRACSGGNQRAYRTIAGASSNATAGYTVIIRGAVYPESLSPAHSGTASQRIVFKAQPGETVTISGSFTGLQLSNRNYLVIDGITVDRVTNFARVADSNFITIQNGVFTNSLGTGTTSSLKVVRGGNHKFLGNMFDLAKYESLTVIDSNRNLIQGNTFGSAEQHQEWSLYCTNFNVIRGNTFANPLQKVGSIMDCGATASDIPVKQNATKYNLVEDNNFAYAPPYYSSTGRNGIQYAAQNGILRRNRFYSMLDAGIALASYALDSEALYNLDNRIFHNTFVDGYCGGIAVHQDPAAQLSGNIIKNNIFYRNRGCENNGVAQFVYRQLAGYRVEYNNLYNSAAGESVIQEEFGAANSLPYYQAQYPTIFANNVERAPLFVNPNAPVRDFRLQSGSPMIDAAAFLTTTKSAGSGTILPVVDAGYFYDGFGIEGETGDLVQLAGSTIRARVRSIDYTTHSITLETALSWNAGQGVGIAYSGSAPDLGAFEYTGSGGSTSSSPVQSSSSASSVSSALSSSSRSSSSSSLASSSSSSSAPSSGSWVPPIGIPRPSFGIEDTHKIYEDPSKRNSALGYTIGSDGPFTHYVNNTHPSATDTSNTYGTVSLPRRTIPLNLPAGSVVEIHGGPYTQNSLGGIGSAAQPIFIRGNSTIVKPKFSSSLYMSGSYVVVENIDQDWPNNNDSGFNFQSTDHFVLRDSIVQNGPERTTSAVSIGNSSYTVLLRSKVHDNGDWLTAGDQDHHGIGGFGTAHHIWILENEMYHNSGDGIQMWSAGNNIYVGRNESHHNKQTGFWVKGGTDIIFSENISRDHVPSGSSNGSGYGWQTAPGTSIGRVWYLFNNSYNNKSGIGPGSCDTGTYYLIGNKIYNNGVRGLDIYNNREVYAINNTIFGHPYSSGFLNGTNYLYNNIIDNLSLDYVTSQTNNFFINTQGDPRFVNQAANDFRLQSTSPAINTGTGNGTAQQVYDLFQQLYGIDIRKDAAGNARPQGGAWDIGAFEYR